ncbi:MAG: threonine--tRNA ligase [Candidatus Spechtbacterales bacterium]
MKNTEIENIRHTFAHVLAQAVLKFHPEAQLGVGPSIEDGFYYDFGNIELSDKELKKIQGEMKKIISRDLKIKKELWEPERARQHYKKLKQPYKLELIDEFTGVGPLGAEGRRGPTPVKKVGMVHTGEEFLDLCRGGHVKSTGELNVDAFKLMRVAGAYWRGDEKNPMLTRIYGVAFETKEELEDHLKWLEEAEKRDHRRLGKELDLFTFSPLVGSGLPLFTPKGTIIRTELQKAVTEISKKYGAQPVSIPHIGKIELYETSGHAEKFGDELLKVKGHYEDFVIKPVNCPHHTQIYASRPRSYRDLPIRFIESTMQYRDEKPGEIGGLTRVRAITVDDGHIFCTVDQIKEEAKNVAKVIEEFYKGLGMWGNHWVSLSVQDPKTPEAYIGEPKDWKKAERMLADISKELKLGAKRVEGEAALYGPKIDFMFKDSLGRERQLATIQLDFAMPKRFGLTYTNEKGAGATPVMIHRAILGSYERFMAILIEHYAGAFPLWLSPVQVSVVPVSEKFNAYGKKVIKELEASGVRVELQDENESLAKKIRNGEKQKTPYLLVVGEKEKKAGSVAVRSRKKGDEGSVKLERFVERVVGEIEKKK